MTDELEYRVPTSWRDRFQEIRDDTPALARVKGFDEALGIAKSFVDRAFTASESDHETWTPGQGWAAIRKTEDRRDPQNS